MKKILFIVLPLLLVGGGVVGAAMMGVIHIPGLISAKKKAKAAAIYTETKEEEPIVQKKAPEPEVVPAVLEPPPDMEKGRRAVAKLWNEMEASSILAIVADWKDDELAEQLRYLAPDKTSELLGVMKADRASRLSKLIQLIVAKEKEA